MLYTLFMREYYSPDNETMIRWMITETQVTPEGTKGVYIITKIDKQGYHFASQSGENDYIEPFVKFGYSGYIEAVEWSYWKLRKLNL